MTLIEGKSGRGKSAALHALEPVAVARVVTFGRELPGKLKTRAAAYQSQLKSTGVCIADARAAVTLYSSKGVPVQPLFSSEGSNKVLEYTHELRVTREAITRLERSGVPVKIELNYM